MTAWLLINVVFEDPSSVVVVGEPMSSPNGTNTKGAASAAGTAGVVEVAERGDGADQAEGSSKRPLRLSSSREAVSDLPALLEMQTQGLTIVAEGLPEVATKAGGGAGIPVLATIETCRFAYGVWEFSPNRVFRFLPTCGALAGQILVGAYEVDGAVVRMSPLHSAPAEITSVFQVEKPSTMRSDVRIRAAGKEVLFSVRQAVTVIRGGLEGDMFRASYAGRNTVRVPGLHGLPSGSPDVLGGGPGVPPSPDVSPSPEIGGGTRSEGTGAGGADSTDPLLELLEQHRGR